MIYDTMIYILYYNKVNVNYIYNQINAHRLPPNPSFSRRLLKQPIQLLTYPPFSLSKQNKNSVLGISATEHNM